MTENTRGIRIINHTLHRWDFSVFEEQKKISSVLNSVSSLKLHRKMNRIMKRTAYLLGTLYPKLYSIKTDRSLRELKAEWKEFSLRSEVIVQ